MNYNNIENLYSKIGDNVVSAINGPWSEIHIYAQVNEQHRKVFFYYLDENNHWVYSLDVLNKLDKDVSLNLKLELYDLFYTLWEEFSKSKQWTQLTMTIYKNGKFKVNLNYNKLPNISSIDLQNIWEYKYLNKLPLSESERKSLIKNYNKFNVV